MGTLIQDVRFAIRRLRKSPAFAAVAAITLALGIGANTAMFSVVNAVLLKPLSFRNPDRLVGVWHVPPAKSFPGMDRFAVSAANYVDWENQNHVFEQMAIISYRAFTLTGGEKPLQVDACAVSPQFFQTLSVPPMLGRTFVPEEDQSGRSKVVVLSFRFWQEHFGSNRDIVGRNILMDGRNFLVAGVMPPSFRFPDLAQMWTPMAWTDQERAVRGEHHYMVIARLKTGVSVKQAQAEMSTISTRLEQLYPADDKGWGAVVVPLHEDMVSDVRPAMLILLGAVVCILLIGCVNVANLILAKGFSRQKEIAVRTALGASTARVFRQVLTESILLSLLGGILGLACAPFGVRLITAFLGDKLPGSIEVSLDSRVLIFTAVASVLTGILSGMLPALRLARKNLSQSLKEGLGRTDADSGGHWTRSALVVSEVALSLVLLIGAGLMIRSLQHLHQVNPGFDPHGVLTMNVAVAQQKFPQPLLQVNFFEQVLSRARTLPGVESAGVIDDIPLNGNGSHQPIAIEGRPALEMSEQPEVDVRLISAGYMSAMRISIVRGRDFNEGDAASGPGAVIISESMARTFWPGENALGKHLTMTFSPDKVREVVGIVQDVKLDSLAQTRPAAAAYVPLDQLSAPSLGAWRSFPMTLVVRTATSPASLTSAVSNAVQQVDGSVPLRDILTMDDVVATSLSQPRFDMLLLGIFAGLALILAAIGIYSVLSYSIKRRVSEIGVRMALGARVTDVLRLVIIEGMKPTLLGIGIGAVVALVFGRVMSNMIYQVKPDDPFTFVMVAFLLAGVALVASLIPAYRATRVDPIVALRYE